MVEKSALVTGAARGIGRATAKLSVEQGWLVARDRCISFRGTKLTLFDHLGVGIDRAPQVPPLTARQSLLATMRGGHQDGYWFHPHANRHSPAVSVSQFVWPVPGQISGPNDTPSTDQPREKR